MTLQELIDFLSVLPKGLIAANGFGRWYSYRGSYDQIAFEPTPNVTVGSMLLHAKSALDKDYTGYKGGEYKVTADTVVNLANRGETPDEPEMTAERLTELFDFLRKQS